MVNIDSIMLWNKYSDKFISSWYILMKSHCNKSIIFLYILFGANSKRGSNLSLKNINMSLKNKLFGIKENNVNAFKIIWGLFIFNLKFSDKVFFL